METLLLHGKTRGKTDVCMTVHHKYNNINNQLDAKITVY